MQKFRATASTFLNCQGSSNRWGWCDKPGRVLGARTHFLPVAVCSFAQHGMTLH